MQVVIVRTCDTSKGRIAVEVPGGTKDSAPLELPDMEAENLIAAGHARRVPPAPAVSPAPLSSPPPAAPAEQET